MTNNVTQLRVVNSEWIKFRSLRSSYVTLLCGAVAMIGMAVVICWAQAKGWPTASPGDRADFDAASWSMLGSTFAQLALGVLGVLVVTGEYSTGMIRATFSAVPRRLPVLWAKAAVFGGVALVISTITALISFYAGQAMLSGQHIQTTLSAPGVARQVFGTALFLTLVGLFGLAIGALVRSTPGGIACVLGLMLALPVIVRGLPGTWELRVNPYLPSSVGEAMMNLREFPNLLAPWTALALLAGYVAVALAAAAILVKRRDA